MNKWKKMYTTGAAIAGIGLGLFLCNAKDNTKIDDAKNSIRQVEKIGKSDYWNFLLCDEKIAKYLDLI